MVPHIRGPVPFFLKKVGLSAEPNIARRDGPPEQKDEIKK